MGHRRNIRYLLFTAISAMLVCTQASSQTLLKNYRQNKVTTPVTAPAKPSFIPPNFHTQHFGFFCRQELRMQQIRVPVMFRLGSTEQCNRLEGKPGYR